MQPSAAPERVEDTTMVEAVRDQWLILLAIVVVAVIVWRLARR